MHYHQGIIHKRVRLRFGAGKGKIRADQLQRRCVWEGENQREKTQGARILKSPLASPPASAGLDLRVPSIWRTLRWVMKKALRLGGKIYITKILALKSRYVNGSAPCHGLP